MSTYLVIRIVVNSCRCCNRQQSNALLLGGSSFWSQLQHLHDECRTYMIEGPPQLLASTTLTAEVESGGNAGMLVPFLVGIATFGAFGLRKQVS